MKIEYSSLVYVKLPISIVYQKAENYPLFVRFYSIKEIIYKDSVKSQVKVGYNWLGFKIIWYGEGLKLLNKSIDYTQTKGILKGMKALWEFSEHGIGTDVKITIKINNVNPILHGFYLSKITKTINLILADLKNYSENG